MKISHSKIYTAKSNGQKYRRVNFAANVNIDSKKIYTDMSPKLYNDKFLMAQVGGLLQDVENLKSMPEDVTISMLLKNKRFLTGQVTSPYDLIYRGISVHGAKSKYNDARRFAQQEVVDAFVDNTKAMVKEVNAEYEELIPKVNNAIDYLAHKISSFNGLQYIKYVAKDKNATVIKPDKEGKFKAEDIKKILDTPYTKKIMAEIITNDPDYNHKLSPILLKIKEQTGKNPEGTNIALILKENSPASISYNNELHLNIRLKANKYILNENTILTLDPWQFRTNRKNNSLSSAPKHTEYIDSQFNELYKKLRIDDVE